MSIEIHIERLVLDGLPMAWHEGPAVQAAVEAELAALFAANGALGQFGGLSVSHVRGDAIRLSSGANAASIGKQVAGAVRSAILGAGFAGGFSDKGQTREKENRSARGGASPNAKGGRG